MEFQAVLKLKPYSPFAHNNLGEIYLKQNRIYEAVEEFKTALIFYPAYINARENLQNAYNKLSGSR